MSLPQFITKQVSEGTTTTVTQVVRVINSLISNLSDIFQTYTNKVQNDSVVLKSISLKNGLNVIPHTLNRTLSGWTVVRQRGNYAQFNDAQDTSPSPGTYLYLNSTAAVVVDIEVF